MIQDPRFEKIVVALGMQARGSGGEHTEAVDSVYDLSNAARLKKSEVNTQFPGHDYLILQIISNVEPILYNDNCFQSSLFGFSIKGPLSNSDY